MRRSVFTMLLLECSDMAAARRAAFHDENRIRGSQAVSKE